jgi:hypothetical protein
VTKVAVMEFEGLVDGGTVGASVDDGVTVAHCGWKVLGVC